MGPLPSLHRVVPAHGSVKSEWILPYDKVRTLLLAAKTFSARDCICRKQQDLIKERSCSFPLHNCLTLSMTARPPRPEDISQEQAVAILDEAEQVGLVHTVSNVLAGVSHVCNCCGCCCGILGGSRSTAWSIRWPPPITWPPSSRKPAPAAESASSAARSGP